MTWQLAEDFAEAIGADIYFMFIASGPVAVGSRPQAEEVVQSSLTAADMASVSLREELTGTMLPSKAFSFIAAGVLLLLSSGDEGELPDLVTKFGLGVEDSSWRR